MLSSTTPKHLPTNHVHRSKAAWLLFLAAALAALFGLGAGRASATITTTQIESPVGSAPFRIDNRDLGTSLTTVAGSTDSTDPARDHVDVWCVTGGHRILAHEVPLEANGTFEVEVPSDQLDGLCRLRAFPTVAGVPANEDPFSGPVTAIGESTTFKVRSGPSTGTQVAFDVYAPQLSASNSYLSAGHCGLLAGYLADDRPEVTTQTFGCSDYFWWTANLEEEADSKSRSELQVDGRNAYLPYSATVNNEEAAGLPELTFSYYQDIHTGNLTLTESEPLVECDEQAFPPRGCGDFVPAGVVLERTIEQNEDGHLVTITDRFSSSDGKAHSLDVLNQQSASFDWTYPRNHPLAFRFPGESAYSPHSHGDVVPFAGDSPGTIYVRQRSTPDGDRGSGRGAIVFDRPASPATFNYDSPVGSDFYLHQAATVPAEGAATFRFAYAYAYTQAEVEALAGKAQAAFASPAPPAPPTPPAGPVAAGGPSGSPSAWIPGPAQTAASFGDVRVAKVDLDRRHGTAQISLLVPGPGQLTLGGRQLRTVKREVGAAGSVVLTVRPNPALAALLRRRGSARVGLEISFAPAAGMPRNQVRKLALVRG